MDSRSFWIFSIALVLVLAWSHFFSEPPPPPAGPARVPAAEAPPSPEPETAQVTVRTPKFTAIFDERGGRLVSFKLRDYQKRKLDPSRPDENVELVTQPDPSDRPLRLTLEAAGAPALEEAPFLADRQGLDLSAGETGQLKFTYDQSQGLAVVKTLTFTADTFLVRQEVTLVNEGQAAWEGRLIHRLNSAPFSGAQGGRYDEMGAVSGRKLMTASAKDAPADLEKKGGRPLSWLGYMDQYFLTALVPDQEAADSPAFRAIRQDHGGLALAEIRPLKLAPGARAGFNFDFYYGPKSRGDLLAAGHDLSLSVDMGWFTFLAAPLAALLRFVHGWAGNYGVAIIIVTILIKIILWPLTAKSYRSMKAMQKLQPKILKIREKYGDDREALNREIMQLYKTFKVSPLGGCLPMLLQIPFFIAFYRVLDSLLELRGAPFVLWISDLAAPERLGSLDFTIPLFEPPTGLPVLTILMGLSMFIQQKMTPNTMGDPIQAKVMMLMPLLFTFILINMPAGLVLYWLVNNILSIGQQTLINRPDKRPAEAT
ncbi:MAG: membrane protein insertase YidC [Candidatus Adiutrix sp.]|jgi:YidC/Oxa1 family membrane protein insertase|nr:membrane protein insertase YidC [Candidatus Adiutrix sp.]